MKQIVNTVYIFLGLFFLGNIVACTKMDDYKKFTNGKEISYTGKVDSLKLHSGNQRIELSWLLIADPKITGVTVYWNNNKDSVVIPVKRSAGVDTMKHIFNNFAEGTYNFVIYTWNNEGSRSVPAYITGKSYGHQYTGSLLNRGLNHAELMQDGNVIIDWGVKEETVIGMEVTYTNTTGERKKVLTPDASAQTVLEQFKGGTTFEYRTLFKPDTLTIDTFYAPLVVRGAKENVTSQYLKNYKRPFERSEWDGNRWGTLKDWVINDAAKNRAGGYGGYDNMAGDAAFCFEKWDGETAIENGKAYQTITLPAGNYEFGFITSGNPNGYKIGSNPRFLVAALGNTLPDVANVTDALSYTSFVDKETAFTQFTLDAPTQVSLGMIMTFTNWGAQGFRIQDIQLFKLP